MQIETYADGTIGVDRGGSLLNVANHAFFVDHEGGPASPFKLLSGHRGLLQDAVLFHDCAVHIAQQWESDANLFCESVVGSRAVFADTEDHGVIVFELGEISLISLEFLRSTLGKCENVKCKNYGLFPAVLAELHRVPVVVQQREVRSDFAHLQIGDGHLGGLLRGSD